MIFCIDLTVVQEINNTKKEHKNNESLVRSNNFMIPKSMAVITKMLILTNYLLNLNKDFSQNLNRMFNR